MLRQRIHGDNADGRFQVGVGSTSVYTSSDYGNTWKERLLLIRKIYDIAISASGKHIVAVSDGRLSTAEFIFWTSHDYGINWTSRSVMLAGGEHYARVVMSANGRCINIYISAHPTPNGKYYAEAYISSDYGNTLVFHAEFESCSILGMSSTGQYQIVNVLDVRYTSSDFGETWITKTVPFGFGDTVYISETGKYWTAWGYKGVYKSSDYGETWVKTTILLKSNITISYDGRYLTVGSGCNILTSSDYGETWKTIELDKNAGDFSMSYDGRVQFGYAGEYCHVSFDFGRTWISRRYYIGSAIFSTVSINRFIKRIRQ